MKRISWLLIVPLVLAAAAAPLACVESLNFSLDTSAAGAGGTGSTSSGMGGTSSSTSSSSSTGSSMSTSGMGGGPHECEVVADCKNEECRTATACTAGLCVWMNKTKNTELVSQLYGDCKTRQCDGNGGVMTIDNPDTKDTYDWANPCYMNSCMAFPNPIEVPEMDQKVCTTPWNAPGHCSMFKCIQCNIDMDCGASSLCLNGRCVPDTCNNGMMDPGETDTDCGGSNCGPCAADKACMVNSDCEGTCDMATLKCFAPSCSDGTLNGDESDIDCGGSCAKEMTPKLCITFQKCLFPGDCDSGVCKLGVCLQATCADYTQNSDEKGIDCGGTGCDFECPTP